MAGLTEAECVYQDWHPDWAGWVRSGAGGGSVEGWKAHMDGCSGALGEPEESCHLGDDWEGPVSWKQTQDK